MLYTAEDAIQIYHAKSSTLEFFAAKVPKADWQGIRKEDIEPAQEYYSDDIIVDFDLLDRDAYEEKVCGGARRDDGAAEGHHRVGGADGRRDRGRLPGGRGGRR